MLETLTINSDVELRSNGGNKLPTIVGYGVVFNQESRDLGGFTETVDPKAVTKTIKEQDIVGLRNHDMNLILGRTSKGTLKLSTDDNGVFYEIEPADTTAARDTVADIEAGNMLGSSFGFRTIRDEWEHSKEKTSRRLLEISMRDIGPVTEPAYLQSTNGIAKRSLATHLGVSLDVIESAIECRSLGALFEGGDAMRTAPFDPPALPDGIKHADIPEWLLREACLITPDGCLIPQGEFADARTYFVAGIDMQLTAADVVYRFTDKAEAGPRYVRSCGNDNCCAPAHIIVGV